MSSGEDKFDDSWFVRLSDLRQEIENHVFPTIGSALDELKGAERAWVKARFAVEIDKVLEAVAKQISGLEARIMFLEGQIKKMEEQNGK